VDVQSIEQIDGRGLALLHEDGVDAACGVRLEGAQMALIVTLDLPPDTTPQMAFDQIGRAFDADAPDTTLVRFSVLLQQGGAFDRAEIALPGETSRLAQIAALREGVPAGLNGRISRAQHAVDRRIEKVAGDLLVPFRHVGMLLDACTTELGGRGLDFAVWGHLSDGNLHPNVIPRSYEDVESGRTALLALGREAIRLGGVPLAEHGVGRNPIKQQLLVELYGTEGVKDMRAVKRAIDPEGKLAPGVIFPAD
jgi:D-lactate dehydrogenase (cytochrome)